MRDRCPECGSAVAVLPESPYGDSGPTYRCVNGHFSTNPTIDFEHIESGVPVAFWMPQERWEALPVFTGKAEGEAILYRDPERQGVVYRLIGSHWWQATISFEPTSAARRPPERK